MRLLCAQEGPARITVGIISGPRWSRSDLASRDGRACSYLGTFNDSLLNIDLYFPHDLEIGPTGTTYLVKVCITGPAQDLLQCKVFPVTQSDMDMYRS